MSSPRSRGGEAIDCLCSDELNRNSRCTQVSTPERSPSRPSLPRPMCLFNSRSARIPAVGQGLRGEWDTDPPPELMAREGQTNQSQSPLSAVAEGGPKGLGPSGGGSEGTGSMASFFPLWGNGLCSRQGTEAGKLNPAELPCCRGVRCRN